MNAMKKYIEKKTQILQKGYMLDTNRITQDYNKEKAELKSYHGREILELLQNADDEALDTLPKKVEISFANGILTVSNYGQPFSKDGVDSLMYSNLSSKYNRNKPVIGNKGTGFRSILSWAEEITIDSGDLHIRFSSKYSQKVLKDLLLEIGEKNIRKKAATLVFPEWNDKHHNSSGYTTIIEIKVKDDKSNFEEIEEQLKQLDSNTLLFLNNTEELIINTSNYSATYKKEYNNKTKDRAKLSYCINGESFEKNWILFKSEGTIADDMDEDREKIYTVTVAYCEEGISPDEQYLYSYFKTDIEFPFPFLAHASFSLDQNRNHLIKDSKANNLMLREMASLMVEAATTIASKKNADYDILKLLIESKPISAELVTGYKFKEKLNNKIRAVEIFPSVNRKYIKFSNKVYWYTSGLSKYLKGPEFDDLLLYIDKNEGNKIYELLKTLNICPQDISDNKSRPYMYNVASKKVSAWIEKLKISSSNSRTNQDKIKNLARTCLYFYDEYAYESDDEIWPQFFVDESGNTISKDAKILIFDEDISITKFPNFIKISTMHPLMEKVILDNVDFLEYDSEYFYDERNIVLFKANEIPEILNEGFENLENVNPSQKKKKWEQILKWLWKNQQALSRTDKVNVLMLSKDGDYYYSNSLYAGEEYGCSICEKLYNKNPQKIVADIRSLLPDSVTEIDALEFLKLLGISKSPKITYEEYSFYPLNYYNYTKNILSELKFPFKMESDTFESLDNLLKRITRISIKQQRIDGLESILKTSDTETIIEWIRNDRELYGILSNTKDTKPNQVYITWDNKRNLKQIIEIRRTYSYIRYLFESVPWIRVGTSKYKPTDCMFDLKTNLSPFLVEPQVSEYIKDLDGKPAELRRVYRDILSKVSVKEDFSGLPFNKIYKILLELPNYEDAGQISKTIYDSLLKKKSNYNENEYTCIERNNFLENGKVFCNNGYQSVNSAYYLAEKTVSNTILKQFNVICIPSRRSAETVEKLFGVKRLKIRGEIVEEPEIHSLNNSFIEKYKAFIPYAFACRLASIKSEADAKDEARKINGISILLCSKVKARYNNDIITELDDYDSIIDDDKKIYLKVPKNLKLSYNTKLSNALALAMCTILDISNAIDPFREIFSCDSSAEMENIIYYRYDDVSLIEKSFSILEFKLANREECYQIISKLTNKKSEILLKYLSNIDFDDFSSDVNARYIIELFKKLKIDVDDYNDLKPSIKIDLTHYYQNEIENALLYYKEQYKIKLYRELQNKSIEEKSRYEEYVSQFNMLVVPVINTVKYNVDKEIRTAYGLNKEYESISLISEFKKNKKDWVAGLSSIDYVEEFLDSNENTSLLYFNEVTELSKKYSEFCHVKKESNVQQRIELKKSVKLVETSSLASSRNKVQLQRNSKSIQKTANVKEPSKHEQTITGYRGEQLVYNYLQEKYTTVDWVSENAKKDDVNPDGRAGLGYDFEVIDHNGKRIYIEVKASKSSLEKGGIRFFVSDNEYRFMREHSENYLIYYVADVNSDSPSLKIISEFNRDGFDLNVFNVESKSEYTITLK